MLRSTPFSAKADGRSSLMHTNLIGERGWRVERQVRNSESGQQTADAGEGAGGWGELVGEGGGEQLANARKPERGEIGRSGSIP